MSEGQSLAASLHKWRGRWPEWNVAEVFVAPAQRETAVAWFALLQELTDAAWSGADPRPGEAKLGWWAEELLGWSQGRRRHPLGLLLQRLPAPWLRLAAALPTLLATRDAATSRDDAFAGALPMAEAIAAVGDGLFATASQAQVELLLARQLLLRGDAAVPLQLRARLGDAIAEHALARAWAMALLQSWPRSPAGAGAERVFAALLHERVRRLSRGRAAKPAGSPSVLWLSWKAARG
jgi:hypothetical protein